jgi:hypothetical protein
MDELDYMHIGDVDIGAVVDIAIAWLVTFMCTSLRGSHNPKSITRVRVMLLSRISRLLRLRPALQRQYICLRLLSVDSKKPDGTLKENSC